MLYQCMTFYQNIFNGFQILEFTQNCLYNDQKELTMKIKQVRVLVLVHDMSSRCALLMYEVSSKEILRFSTCTADTKLHLLMFQMIKGK